MTPRNASIEKEEHEFSYFEHSLERNKTFMEEPKSKIGMGAKYAVRVKPRLQTEEENTLSTISLNNTRRLKKKKKERVVRSSFKEVPVKLNDDTFEDASSTYSRSIKQSSPTKNTDKNSPLMKMENILEQLNDTRSVEGRPYNTQD